jgi:hypothetical protein
LTVLCAALAVWTAGSAVAQDRTLQETLDHINETLAANAYDDHDGKSTVSEVAMRRGRLVVEVKKVQPGSTVSNVYEAAVGDIDVTSIATRSRGDHIAIMMQVRGEVVARLKCVTGGNVSQWDLPARTDITVELRTNQGAATEVAAALSQLIVMAQQSTGE